ncbi:tail fiber assembly protein [Pseudomonas phage vB_PF_Y1-MI]|nr:tail fiber assembly protein [Pseudomonas phage vB_PF_Y1-MI]
MIFYSEKVNAFFDDNFKEAYEKANSWPEDAVEVSSEIHQEFGIDQPPEGKQRCFSRGKFKWVREVISLEDMKVSANLWRMSMLEKTDGIVSRHRDQLDMEEDTTLSGEEFKELLQFRKALRDWPDHRTYPKTRPSVPVSIT